MTTEQNKFEPKKYLSIRHFADRMALLNKMSKDGTKIPASLAEDLMLLQINNIEKQAILEVTGANDNKSLEHFLTANIASWDQDLAATAVRVWSKETDHLMWSRMYELSRSPLTPQRVLYTIVDLAANTGGLSIVQSTAEYDVLKEMSDAFIGLLLHRALQWNFKNQNLINIAQTVVNDLDIHLHPDNKALPSAISFLARFDGDRLRDLSKSSSITETWKDLVKAVCSDLEHRNDAVKKLNKLITSSKKITRANLVGNWIPLWNRNILTQEQVSACLRIFFSEPVATIPTGRSPFTVGTWEIFGGIEEPVLAAAVFAIEDEEIFSRTLTSLQGLLRNPTPKSIKDQLKSRIGSSANPAAFLNNLPLRLRLELTDNSSSKVSTPFSRIDAEQTAILQSAEQIPRAQFFDYDNSEKEWNCPEEKAEFVQRRKFFDIAYRNKKQNTTTLNGKDYFSILAAAWQAPDDTKLGQIAQVARQEEGILRLCYINTIGRFKGMDQAALKTLDFIRSKEDDELHAIINALAGVGTPRASQELVASLTRPNISPQLQMEICAHLGNVDLGNLQKELRSALSDLNVTPNVNSDNWDIRDAIASLLTPSEAVMTASTSTASTNMIATAGSDQDLDRTLSGLIPNYKELSSEVKRALRTSLFFHQQVSSDHAPTSIDLSPVIDMQYKAMELLFRESFEDHCSKIIHRGVLQRKLDIIGYARPIPRAMDEFEHYIASLPTVRDIPFFSSFKLRKMLRAICQFRPGRRFTLDGLKAFALFFLCFGRSECKFGLQGLFETPYKTDSDLFDFCKTLHIFQDFRNRAAHEGFHPDASNDIDGIWRHTAEIVQNMWKLKQHIDGQSGPGQGSYNTPVSKSAPVIEKKVS